MKLYGSSKQSAKRNEKIFRCIPTLVLRLKKTRNPLAFCKRIARLSLLSRSILRTPKRFAPYFLPLFAGDFAAGVFFAAAEGDAFVLTSDAGFDAGEVALLAGFAAAGAFVGA